MLDSKSDARAGVQNAATGPTEIAPRPFDRADADVILRSSDHIDFHVHRAKLSIASSFFNAMFSLPQTSDTHLDVQIVDVTEDSSTMNAILRMCYPVVDRSISSFAVLSSALRAALKYDMELAVELCKQSLRLWVHSQPLQVYAVACRVEDESIARLAAVKLLLRYIRGDIGKDGAAFLTFCHPESPPMPELDILGDTVTHVAPTSALPADADCPILFADAQAIVLIVTADERQLRVAKEVIALASPILSEMLSRAQDATKHCNEDNEQNVPMLHVEESSQIINHLLRILHPSLIPSPIDATILPNLLQVAIKYKMEKVVWFLRQQFDSLSASEPLRLYLLAASHGWKKEACTAAKAALDQRFVDLEKTYVSELEVAPAGPYYRLLKYHQACGEAASVVKISDFKVEDLHSYHYHRDCHWRGTAHVQQLGRWLQERPAPSGFIAGLVATGTENVNGPGYCDVPVSFVEDITFLSQVFDRGREIEAAIAKASALFIVYNTQP
ncbi:hypothetical protein POSPLADRAFT_1158028 [Postia placenta MAD-698-R-SB12]|uniref:BTB domain-containing protein n=1 Tax=Postia placenta MAD-698-R-SB12 TaxID=670580 RepID=A0A1X6MLB7_9APHY|nr:hypothetical protein POSPLADRAFT_1158028 [Postia placenta MAD-698-R-SB12]OSX57016.1 hypothetical protein POSPLADRAFT_1158028 [Postia placenta MAD-698-R-SB12]